jgi:hypothetical protein
LFDSDAGESSLGLTDRDRIGDQSHSDGGGQGTTTRAQKTGANRKAVVKVDGKKRCA